ncbi:unnamed protein product, partial [Ectocarpus sp. 6 AP-2014]
MLLGGVCRGLEDSHLPQVCTDTWSKTGNTPEQRGAFLFFPSMQLRLHQSSMFRERN